jgi:electron transfer flavoprotein alpha subunit
MTIAFVLPRPDYPTEPFEAFIAPIKKSDDSLECWLAGLESGLELCPPGRNPGAGSVPPDGWDPRFIEGQLQLLAGLWAERRPGLILFPASPGGHDLGVRLAARVGGDCFPGTRALLREEDRLFARRRVCGSNLEGDMEIRHFPAVLTVAEKPGAASGSGGALPRVSTGCAAPPGLPAWLLDYELTEAAPANPLESAPLIFAAGQGLGSRAACDRLRRLAGRFGAPLGFSRPAAMNGWGKIGEIIGQSGVRTGAERCLALGVSGAAAFMAGIEPVSTLIAVNPDKNAPIFRYADVGIIAEAEEFMDALEEAAGHGE